MRRIATVLGAAGVLVAGTTAAVALGAGAQGHATASTSTAGTTTSEKPAVKVWLCHHTGSWKHPYHLIHVAAGAVPAHRRHGDVDPGAAQSCPSVQPAGAKLHGPGGAKGKSKSAHAHGQGAQHGDAPPGRGERS